MAAMFAIWSRACLLNGIMITTWLDVAFGSSRVIRRASMMTSEDPLPNPSDGNSIAHETSSSVGASRVFLCGYEYESFATFLFPSAKVESLHLGTPLERDDVVLIGQRSFYASAALAEEEQTMETWQTYQDCDWGALKAFQGVTVMINGEYNVDPDMVPFGIGGPILYLGPSAHHGEHYRGALRHQFYYAQMGAIVLGHTKLLEMRKPDKDATLIHIASHCVPHRQTAFDELTTMIKELYPNDPSHWPVAGGMCSGSFPELRHQLAGDWSSIASKRAELNYMFNLCMENRDASGYITEKIVNAFMIGSVPIWSGSREVFKIFNPNAFIYYDVSNSQVALDKVKYLIQNKTAYEEVLAAPILQEGAWETYFQPHEILKQIAMLRN